MIDNYSDIVIDFEESTREEASVNTLGNYYTNMLSSINLSDKNGRKFVIDSVENALMCAGVSDIPGISTKLKALADKLSNGTSLEMIPIYDRYYADQRSVSNNLDMQRYAYLVPIQECFSKIDLIDSEDKRKKDKSMIVLIYPKPKYNADIGDVEDDFDLPSAISELAKAFISYYRDRDLSDTESVKMFNNAWFKGNYIWKESKEDDDIESRTKPTTVNLIKIIKNLDDQIVLLRELGKTYIDSEKYYEICKVNDEVAPRIHALQDTLNSINKQGVISYKRKLGIND